MIDETSIQEFKATLRGGLIEPRDQGYDEARKVYNGMISKRPRMIVHCADVADVIRSVNFARENKMPLSIRSGGHNAGGLGICDDGLVIDLSLIKYTHRQKQLQQAEDVHGGILTMQRMYSEWQLQAESFQLQV
jgi:FAD/FMN-containing dehydrogenase